MKADGFDVELIILEQVSNEEIRKAMASVDIVADQLVIGWYAMFALEAMAMGKPVLCYLREDLESFYINAGLIDSGEIPIVKCNPSNVKSVIRSLVLDRERWAEIGARSREYAVRHHSTQAVGKIFDRINRSFGVIPSRIIKFGIYESSPLSY